MAPIAGVSPKWLLCYRILIYVSFLGCFFVKLPYDMEHDVPRNRIVYGFHPSLCVKRSAYGTKLAEQIMSG